MWRDNIHVESIFSALLRATVDLCWLLPAGTIVAEAFSDYPNLVVGTTPLVAALYLPALAAGFFGERPEHLSLTRAVGATILLAVWWLSNRPLFTDPSAPGLAAILFAIASGLYLGIATYRGLAAAVSGGSLRFPRALMRGTIMTSLVLLYLRIVELPVPIWPALVLPIAIVAIGVSERSSTGDPTEMGSGLRLGGRGVITLVVAAIAILLALLVTATLSAGFWTGVLSLLGFAWRVIGTGIAYLAYPVIYVVFLIFQFIRGFFREIEPHEEATTPGPPELPEEIAQATTGASPWAILALQVLLAIAVGLFLYWLFRTIMHRRERPDPGQWEEVRESIWEPGMLQSALSSLFTRGDGEAPTYRTNTERQVRTIFRRLYTRVLPLRRAPDETARTFVGRLARHVQSLEGALTRLVRCYERARYAPPVEDEELVRTARIAWGEVSRGWREVRSEDDRE